MQALWDRHPELPYAAWAPWPQYWVRGHLDWEQSVYHVEAWLVHRVGLRWVDWTWGWATFAHTQQANLCCVNFRRQPDTSLFILQFS